MDPVVNEGLLTVDCIFDEAVVFFWCSKCDISIDSLIISYKVTEWM